jgi:hypothetical protein
VSQDHCETHFLGEWINGGKGVKDHYLGLKFLINTAVHYGWARLNFKYQRNSGPFAATLTGYAYETIPNKAITTGKTHANGAALGGLALGAAGVTASRQQ